MSATTWTQADLDAIRRTIARGEKSVQFSDRNVVYRSTEELLQAERRIASALAGAKKIRYIRTVR